MFKKILVPLDGSQLAESALDMGLKLAEKSDAELILLRVPELKQVLAPASTAFDTYHLEMTFEKSTKESTAYFDSLQGKLAGVDSPVRTLVVPGNPSDVIKKTAEAEGVDLIVMTSHGRSGWRKWAMGSVATDVLGQTAVPILVLREDVAIDSMLIALDGSALAEAVLEPAMNLAKAFDANVTLLRVQEALTYVESRQLAQADTREPNGSVATAVRGNSTTKFDHYLDELATKYRVAGVTAETVSVIGDPATHIVNMAEARDLDLVVMATHGHTGFKKLVFGSVTDHVVKHREGAMLIVRPS